FLHCKRFTMHIPTRMFISPSSGPALMKRLAAISNGISRMCSSAPCAIVVKLPESGTLPMIRPTIRTRQEDALNAREHSQLVLLSREMFHIISLDMLPSSFHQVQFGLVVRKLATLLLLLS